MVTATMQWGIGYTGGTNEEGSGRFGCNSRRRERCRLRRYRQGQGQGSSSDRDEGLI